VNDCWRVSCSHYSAHREGVKKKTSSNGTWTFVSPGGEN